MKNIIYTSLVFSCFLTACKKDINTQQPTVGFTPLNARSTSGDTLIYKLGDTSKFNINGYADNIAFWSGAVGFNYDNKIQKPAIGKVTLSFTSLRANLTEANTLQILAIKNLTKLDSATIVNAPWTDITNRVLLPAAATAVNSGNVDLSDLVTSPDDVLNVAFRFKSALAAGTRPNWTITNYLVKNTGQNFAMVQGNLADDANFWTRFGNNFTNTNRRWVATNTSLAITGGIAPAEPVNESWIVSKPMYIGRIAPDVLTQSVKNLVASEITRYDYRYPTVGTYKATFNYYNNTVSDTKSGVKQFWIKIIP